jgi:hypothetical protein
METVRTTRTSVTLKTEVCRAAQQRAKDDHRSLSNFIAILVENHVGADLPVFLRHEPTGVR